MGRLDLQAGLGAQEQGVAHGVHVHGPAHAEIQHQAVFEADQRAGEIVHGEFAAALYGIVILGVLSEIIGGIGGNGDGLAIAHRVQRHVQSVTADVRQAAHAGQILLHEGASGNAPAAAAAGLDVIDVAQFAGANQVLDHLHVLAVTGLEADGEDLAGLLLAFGHLNGLVQGDGHGLFAQHVHAGFHGLAGAGVMLGVIGANGHAVGLQGQQISVFLEGGYVGKAEFVQERPGLAGNDVGSADDFHIVHVQIAPHVGMGDAAGTDDADAQFFCHK